MLGSARRGAEISDALVRCRHGGGTKLAFANRGALVVEEYEQLVLHERRADIAAELVLNVFGLGEALAIREEIGRVELAVAKVLVREPVDLIGPALGDHADGGAGVAPVFGRVRIRYDLELLDGVNGGADDLSGQLLNIFGDGVVVDTVENEVVLQRPDAMHIESAGASGAGSAALVGVTLSLNAGDQVHQIVPTAQ